MHGNSLSLCHDLFGNTCHGVIYLDVLGGSDGLEDEVGSVEGLLAKGGGHKSFVTTGRDIVTEGVTRPEKQRGREGEREAGREKEREEREKGRGEKTEKGREDRERRHMTLYTN